jgi:hypothetical protein
MQADRRRFAAPKGDKPIRWSLATAMPVNSLEDALRCDESFETVTEPACFRANTVYCSQRAASLAQ